MKTPYCKYGLWAFELLMWFNGNGSFSVLFISSCDFVTQMLLCLCCEIMQIIRDDKVTNDFHVPSLSKSISLLIFSVCRQRTSDCEHESGGIEERHVFVVVLFISCTLLVVCDKISQQCGRSLRKFKLLSPIVWNIYTILSF